MWKDDACLLEMLQAARDTTSFLEGRDEAGFYEDRVLHHAIMMLLVVIGENAHKISKDFQDTHHEIPWRSMYGIRNFLIHAYGEIRLDQVDRKIEFYQHDQKWANRMILGNSLHVMTSLAEKEGLKGKVQMIYIDPPYGIKFGSNLAGQRSKAGGSRREDRSSNQTARATTCVSRYVENRYSLDGDFAAASRNNSRTNGNQGQPQLFISPARPI